MDRNQLHYSSCKANVLHPFLMICIITKLIIVQQPSEDSDQSICLVEPSFGWLWLGLYCMDGQAGLNFCWAHMCPKIRFRIVGLILNFLISLWRVKVRFRKTLENMN